MSEPMPSYQAIKSKISSITAALDNLASGDIGETIELELGFMWEKRRVSLRVEARRDYAWSISTFFVDADKKEFRLDAETSLGSQSLESLTAECLGDLAYEVKRSLRVAQEGL